MLKNIEENCKSSSTKGMDMFMYRLMIVDDEATFREYISKTIDWNSYNIEVCCQARNGVEALEMAEKYKPQIVLADINMPIMDGLELSYNLKTSYPDIGIIMITGYGEFEYAKKAIKIGVEDYILKPIDKEELIETVLRIINEINKKNEESRKLSEYKKQVEENRSKSQNLFLKGLLSNDLKINDEKMTRAKKIVLQAKEVIQDNISNCELSIDFIASKIYINPGYLRTIFKQETGITIIEYITNIRMNLARDLIICGNIKLSEVSLKAGYSDAAYFSKCFKKFFGINPSEYRNY